MGKDYNENQCGFLATIYFMHLKSGAEVEHFNREFKVTKGLTAKDYSRRRKQASKHFNKALSYVNNNKEKEKDNFVSYFSFQNFKKLSAASKLKHSYNNCLECAENHRPMWIMKRSNKCHLETPAKTALNSLKAVLDKTPTEITATVVDDFVRNVIKPVKEKLKGTPFSAKLSIGSKRKAVTVDDVPKKVRRAIIKSANDEMNDETTNKDFISLYASKQSQSEWDVQRKRSFGERRQNRKKSHTGRLTDYTFNEIVVKSTLKENEDINWSALSKSANLKNANNKAPRNAGQVRLNQIVTTADV